MTKRVVPVHEDGILILANKNKLSPKKEQTGATEKPSVTEVGVSFTANLTDINQQLPCSELQIITKTDQTNKKPIILRLG